MEPPPHGSRAPLWSLPPCPTRKPAPCPSMEPAPLPLRGARPHVCGGSLSSPSLCFSFSVLFTTVVALGVYHAHMLSVHGCWRCFVAFIPKHALHHCRFCSLQRRQTVIQQPPALITFAHSSPYNMRPHFPGDRVVGELQSPAMQEALPVSPGSWRATECLLLNSETMKRSEEALGQGRHTETPVDFGTPQREIRIKH